MPPYAVRVRTATGWQDIALSGPPGPIGPQGAPSTVPGPAGPVGGTQMYSYFDFSDNTSKITSGTSITSFPLKAIAAKTSQSDGTNKDFTLNPNGSLQIRNAGFYEINAGIGPGSNNAAGYLKSGLYLTGTDTTGTDPFFWNYFDLHSVSLPASPSNEVTNRHAVGRYFNAGDNLAVCASSSPGSQFISIYHFSISRIGSGPQGAKGDPSTVPGPMGTVNPYQIGQTWGVGGLLAAGMIIPVIFTPKRTNQSITVVGARAMIQSGTSVGVQLQRNGTNVGSVLTVTPTPGSGSFSQTISDGDRLGLVISAPVGSPSDLSYTVYLEHTAS